MLCSQFLLFIGSIGLNAQNAIPASGGNAAGTGGSVSYTVGQVVYSQVSGTNGIITQGVQQPFEISVVTAIKEADGITLEMIVYPNPATDFIRLRIVNFEIENLVYRLYDITGSMLKTDEVDVEETTISMQDLRPSTYFLKIIQGTKDIKTFKLIKN